METLPIAPIPEQTSIYEPTHETSLQDEFLGVSDERLALWYHDVMQDHTSADSSLRLRLLQEITTRGITVTKLLEYTAQSAGTILQ